MHNLYTLDAGSVSLCMRCHAVVNTTTIITIKFTHPTTLTHKLLCMLPVQNGPTTSAPPAQTGGTPLHGAPVETHGSADTLLGHSMKNLTMGGDAPARDTTSVAPLHFDVEVGDKSFRADIKRVHFPDRLDQDMSTNDNKPHLPFDFGVGKSDGVSIRAAAIMNTPRNQQQTEELGTSRQDMAPASSASWLPLADDASKMKSEVDVVKEGPSFSCLHCVQKDICPEEEVWHDEYGNCSMVGVVEDEEGIVVYCQLRRDITRHPENQRATSRVLNVHFLGCTRVHDEGNDSCPFYRRLDASTASVSAAPPTTSTGPISSTSSRAAPSSVATSHKHQIAVSFMNADNEVCRNIERSAATVSNAITALLYLVNWGKNHILLILNSYTCLCNDAMVYALQPQSGVRKYM